MEYRTLGRTGLKLSALSFGASSLGGVFGRVDEAEGIAAVHVALEAGINYLDVAPAYGATVAETLLGRALRGVPRERFVLSTKAGKYPVANGPDELDFSEQRIRAELDRSLERLGVDRVDLVHLHDIEYGQGRHLAQAFAEGFPTLAALREEGRIGAVGAGTYPMDVWHRVLAEAPVDAVMIHNHYCLIDTCGLQLVEACLERGIGMINAAPFACGLLTGGEIVAWHPAEAADRRILGEAARFCRERGSSLAKLALQFAAHDTPFDTTMFSSARPGSVERNLAWYHGRAEPELVTEVRRILGPLIDRQWVFDVEPQA